MTKSRPRKRDLYFEIAAQHCPPDLRFITILPSKADRSANYWASSAPNAGIILVQRPDTLPKLKRFLHECAHVKLHKGLWPGARPYHSLELDAEKYAINAITQSGLQVSDRLLSSSICYIYGELLADLRARLEPAPGVFEFIGYSEAQAKELMQRMNALPPTTEFLRRSNSGEAVALAVLESAQGLCGLMPRQDLSNAEMVRAGGSERLRDLITFLQETGRAVYATDLNLP
jgi:hypothetical protein